MKELLELLKAHNQNEVKAFAAYCQRELANPKSPHFQKLSQQKLAEMFERVKGEGLVLDGKHITIQSTGITYDYIAYKNKMLIAYPETIMDVDLVYREDKFSFSKTDSKVSYEHIKTNPFAQNESDIIGAYCVIKNRRGEFLTTLTKEELEKHRQIAKGDFIWKNWLREMYLKTIVRKGVKVHYDDVFAKMNEDDNEHYSLPVNKSLKYMALDMLEQSTMVERTQKAHWEFRIENSSNAELSTIIEELRDYMPAGNLSSTEINAHVQKIASK